MKPITQHTYDSLRNEIVKGQIENALEKLREEIPAANISLLNQLDVLESRIHSLKEKQIQGIIDPRETALMENQISISALSLIENAYRPTSNRKRYRIGLVFLAVLLLVSCGGIFYSIGNADPPSPPLTLTSKLPFSDTSNFNILIYPKKEPNINNFAEVVHDLILDHSEEIHKIDPRIEDRPEQAFQTLNYRQASLLNKQNRANLSIWTPGWGISKDSAQIKIRYRVDNHHSSSYFPCAEGQKEFKESIHSINTFNQGTLRATIDQIVLLAHSLYLHSICDFGGTLSHLESMLNLADDDIQREVIQLWIAQIYREMAKTAKEKEAYFLVLEKFPKNAVALNNLAVLHFKEKQYEKAKAGFELAMSSTTDSTFEKTIEVNLREIQEEINKQIDPPTFKRLFPSRNCYLKITSSPKRKLFASHQSPYTTSNYIKSNQKYQILDGYEVSTKKETYFLFEVKGNRGKGWIKSDDHIILGPACTCCQ